MAVEVGQVWVDNDKRNDGLRRVRVELIDKDRAKCWSYYANEIMGRYVWIRLDRFRANATGYRLETDTAAAAVNS